MYWAMMMPEFPLAPVKAASAMLFIVSLTDPEIFASKMIACMVEERLLPVSPSATGNTLISFKLFLFFMTSCAPDTKE